MIYSQTAALLLGVIMVTACSDGSDRSASPIDGPSVQAQETTATRISMVEAAAWDYQSKTRDGFPEHRPDTIDCKRDTGWRVEDGEIEIRTDDCNYLSLTQESLLNIPAGNRLELALSHGDLSFRENATAHVALSIAGVLLWEQHIDIPSESSIYRQDITLDFDIAQRDAIEIHLHNHGSNAWTLHSLDAIVTGEFDPDAFCPSFESTYEAIQATVFEQKGCASSLCHSADSAAGGLDLSTDAAYGNLVDVASVSSEDLRIAPRRPSDSYLYQKLAAKTQPGSFDIAGSPMPSGTEAISSGQLEAMRLWIEAGAPRTGSVGDTLGRGEDEIERLLGVCLPEPDAVNVIPLDPPAPDRGLQFLMPAHEVLAETERELCFAVYEDFRDVIPHHYMDPSSNVFYVHGNEVREDPFTHHNVLIYSGVPVAQIHDESFGQWTCAGGDLEGQICEPTDLNSCGEASQCRSEVRDSIACRGYGPGTGLIEDVDRINQFSVGGGPDTAGFYEEVPTHGIFYWNSHAFNLTTSDAKHHVWHNLKYADDRRYEADRIIYSRNIFAGAGTEPFTTREVCREYVLNQGDALLNVSSHTHKRGTRFTMALKGEEDKPFYTSTNYDEPLQLNFDPPWEFNEADPKTRTIVYCSLYNNGVNTDGAPNLDTVTRLSLKPTRSACTPTVCVAGKIGASCKGRDDNASCDSAGGAGDGFCDACPISAGVTSDDEMFILLGSRAANYADQLAGSASPSFEIEMPTEGSSFTAGDTITVHLAMSNFQLMPPEAHDADGGHAGAHEGDTSGADHLMVREGHYHIYLDAEDDSADHLTQWTPMVDFQLPDDIAPGSHFLRINLRAPDHHALGIEERVHFVVSE